MKLSFREDIRSFTPAHADPRRTQAGDLSKPITLSAHTRPAHAPFILASGILGFVCLAGLGGASLFDLHRESGWLDLYTYRIIRLITVATVLVLVLVDAFRNNAMFGFLSFFPPFLVYYGYAMADSPALRGMMLGLTTWLAAELFVIRKSSLYEACRVATNQMVQSGHHWLQTANR